MARRRDTASELALRREFHARGLRYRVAHPIPGQPRRTTDIAFIRVKVAVCCTLRSARFGHCATIFAIIASNCSPEIVPASRMTTRARNSSESEALGGVASRKRDDSRGKCSGESRLRV